MQYIILGNATALMELTFQWGEIDYMRKIQRQYFQITTSAMEKRKQNNIIRVTLWLKVTLSQVFERFCSDTVISGLSSILTGRGSLLKIQEKRNSAQGTADGEVLSLGRAWSSRSRNNASVGRKERIGKEGGERRKRSKATGSFTVTASDI